MGCGIYSIKINNDVLYVGQSCNMPRRWRYHKWQLRNGTHANSYLQNIYNSHKDLEFYVEEIVADRRNLTKREIYHIKKLRPKCNFVIPSMNDTWIFSHERNKKISISSLGKQKSLEHRKNISLSRVGSKNPMFGKTPWNKGDGSYMQGYRNHFYGRKHSDDTRKNISNSKKKPLDLKVIVSMRDNGSSFGEIANALGVSRKTISRRYYGRQK
jgi:group I intron endonuclease